MTQRRIPVIPTIVVVAAAAVMVALGFWQLDRRGEKLALIERAEAALQSRSKVEWPTDDSEWEDRAYRWTDVTCRSVLSQTSRAARNIDDQPGWGHFARCEIAGDGEGEIGIGWSRNPQSPEWEGGPVEGILAPSRSLVSARGLAGLETLAYPDPANLPNNHLAYAGQWFFFALTALAVYFLALRRRWRDQG